MIATISLDVCFCVQGVLAGKTLQNFFGATCTSKEREKRRVALHVANVFFKVHFRLNMLQMCKHLMKTFQSASFAFGDFALADRVTYKYYAGKLALVEQEYKEARNHLEYAYKWCMRVSMANVQKILRCLIPVSKIFNKAVAMFDCTVQNELVISCVL